MCDFTDLHNGVHLVHPVPMRKLKAAKHDAAAVAMCMGLGWRRWKVFMMQGSAASGCSGRRAQIKSAQHGVLS